MASTQVVLLATFVLLFKIDGTQQDISCSDEPCENGGACWRSIAGGYFCACLPGYTGKNCTDFNHCHNVQPCHNGGTCNNGVNNYTCSCVPGYTGSNCSDIDYRVQLPCQNGGTCSNGVNNYTCSCVPDYTGSNCSDIDYCFQQPCHNGGSCTNGLTNFTCSCIAGYAGITCNVDERCRETCTDGKTCRYFERFLCLCERGRIGKNCEASETLKMVIPVSVQFTNDYNEKYSDLQSQEAQEFVKNIEKQVFKEMNNTGLEKVEVVELRRGSVIAELKLSFKEPIGESEVDALLLKVTEDGKLGNLSVIRTLVGAKIEGKEETPSVESDKDKVANTIIALLAVGIGLIVRTVIALVAILIYICRKHY